MLTVTNGGNSRGTPEDEYTVEEMFNYTSRKTTLTCHPQLLPKYHKLRKEIQNNWAILGRSFELWDLARNL